MPALRPAPGFFPVKPGQRMNHRVIAITIVGNRLELAVGPVPDFSRQMRIHPLFPMVVRCAGIRLQVSHAVF